MDDDDDDDGYVSDVHLADYGDLYDIDDDDDDDYHHSLWILMLL